MKSVGTYEAKTHLPRLLAQVEKGESITITKRGKPIAKLVPADAAEQKDVKQVIEEMLDYRDQHGPVLGDDLTLRKMIEEGRP
jgi:prevent-host-death family protein